MGARPNGQWPEVNGTVPGRPIRALAGSWRGAGQCPWLAAWAWVVTVDLGQGLWPQWVNGHHRAPKRRALGPAPGAPTTAPWQPVGSGPLA